MLILAFLDKWCQVGKINQKKQDKILSLLTFSKELKNLEKVDFVIEAAVENAGASLHRI